MKTKSWIEFAARDLKAAERLIDDEYVANVVLFLSQQCVEKCLKAILEEHRQNVPKIHGVNKLCSLVTGNTAVALSISNEELDLIDETKQDRHYP